MGLSYAPWNHTWISIQYRCRSSAWGKHNWPLANRGDVPTPGSILQPMEPYMNINTAPLQEGCTREAQWAACYREEYSTHGLILQILELYVNINTALLQEDCTTTYSSLYQLRNVHLILSFLPWTSALRAGKCWVIMSHAYQCSPPGLWHDHGTPNNAFFDND